MVAGADLRRLREAVNASAEIIFMTDADGIITFVNRQFEETYGYTAAEIIGCTTPRMLKSGRQDSDFYRSFWRDLRSGKTVRGEMVNRKKNGEPLVVEVSVSPTWDETRTKIIGFLAIQRDITERKRSEEDLRRKTLVLATEHEATIDGILVVDEHDMILSFNTQFAAMWNIAQELLATGHDGPLLAAVTEQIADPEAFLARVKFLYEHRDQVARDEIELKDGRTFDRYTAPMRESDGRYYGRVWFFRDITSRKHTEKTLLQTQEHLRHDAFFDRLTGLANRTLLIEHLDNAVARHRRHPTHRFGLLFVDLDNFKLVNDSLGHDMGDQLLFAFARRLEACLRADDVLARLGGDEFVVLANEHGEAEDLQRLAARIQAELRKPFQLGDREIVTTVSIGIAQSPTEGATSARDMLRDADTAMYQAKKAGKACSLLFHEDMHHNTVERFHLGNDLRAALSNGEFRIYYQPIFNANTGHIVALESLLRWRHQSRGLLAPGDFYVVADEIGVMNEIGEWGLRLACADIQAWDALGLAPIRVALNVSPNQFRDPKLSEMIGRVLRETGVDPKRIELELSENIVLTDERSTIDQLDRLARTGVRLSVDDFGVVHTSVRYLARFPITTLKIDRCFVRDLAVDRAGPIVLKALIDLGHSLSLNVVIEGVETAEQLSFVRSCRCDEIQGYFTGNLVMREEASALLQAQPANGTPSRHTPPAA
jgi:diguanylate cyclase (GGDEF)-like protein/PAS domain S-box-containing protein